jgi:hypothetical protein
VTTSKLEKKRAFIAKKGVLKEITDQTEYYVRETSAEKQAERNAPLSCPR